MNEGVIFKINKTCMNFLFKRRTILLSIVVFCVVRVMHSLALYISGNDDHGRMLRRTLMRYLNLSLILVLRSISSAVKRRFPTMDHLVEAGQYTVSQ